MSVDSVLWDDDIVGRTTNRDHPPWPGTIVATCRSYLKQEVLVRNEELTSYHQTKDFEEVKGRDETPVSNLPESSSLVSTLAQHCVGQEEAP